MLDDYAMDIIRKNKNMLVPWYLMCAYSYYKDDDALVTDTTYDAIGRMLHKSYDEIEHPHKSIIDKGDLEAGTFLGEYPSRIVGAVREARLVKISPTNGEEIK